MSVARQSPQQPSDGGEMGDGDTADSAGDAALSEADVFAFVRSLGHANHFVRWLAILRLENEGAYPINSSTVQRILLDMTGEFAKSRSVITSLESLENVGVLEKEEVGGRERHHWYITEYGREIAHEIIVLWTEALACPEAAEALRASSNDHSDEQTS